MDAETLKAINMVSNKIQSVEQKLDNYFLTLHNENSDAIDDIIVQLLNTTEDTTNA